jgi:hypothetical protein
MKVEHNPVGLRLVAGLCYCIEWYHSRFNYEVVREQCLEVRPVSVGPSEGCKKTRKDATAKSRSRTKRCEE